MLLEQHGGELAGRVEVELAAGHLRASRPPGAGVGAELVAEAGEQRAVDRDPLPLHVGQDADQRHLDLAEQRLGRGLGERRREDLVQGEHRGAVRAAVVGRRRHRHLGERDLRLPLPRQVVIGLHRAAEMLEAQSVSMAWERRPGSSTKLASIES